MNKEEIIKEAKRLHEEFDEYRDVYEKLIRDIEIQESYMEFNSGTNEDL